MNINQSKLSFQKLTKIPERIIYGNGTRLNFADTGVRFNIADTRTGAHLGTIKATTRKFSSNHVFYKNTEPVKVLCINDLNVFEFTQRRGVGTDLVNFAKGLAKRLGCEDRIFALAYNYKHPGTPPHVFWWKQGFITTSQEDNKILKRAASDNTGIPVDMCFGTTMFFNNKKP